MYKKFTAIEWKKILGLPEDYKISGFIINGTWNVEDAFGTYKKNLDTLGIKYEVRTLENFLSHILEVNINSKKYWFVCAYGGARLSEYAHIACLLGSKKNICVGSCGGLQKQGSSADVIIPTQSYGAESCTRMYARNNKLNLHKSNPKLSKEIEILLPKNLTIWKGPIVTCQAMLAETLTDIKTWTKIGFLGVEMETSTLFAVSNHFKVPCAAMVYISDNLVKGQTVGDEKHIEEKAKRRLVKDEIFMTAIRAILL